MKTLVFVLLLLFPCVLTLPHLQRSNDSPKPAESSKSAVIYGSQISSEVPKFESAVKLTSIKDFSDKSVLSSKKDDTSDTPTETNTETEGESQTPSATASPSLANLSPKKLLANSKIQEAIVEKGIEVAGKLVDKQLQIIDEAQEKAANFLKKEIKLDILPDKGWENEDMFKPPGYHIDASVSGPSASPKDVAGPSFVFPAGIGGALMNGCYGSGYQERDPCYKMKRLSGICRNMIDGAAFLGVGFDGQGKYSPESRKVSIVQRKCANKQTYDTLDVPDTMNVHGIYDTSASMMTYESREEYRRHLQEEAGVSGSIFGFSAGVKEAWGMASASAAQKYMAVMDIDVDRYEIFMDEVKPHDLSMSFLREYLNLPTSYFSAGGPLKYQNFIQRWGTHFIKSAKFGGQLEIRKTMDARDVSEKREFEVQMEMEYKTLFASVGAKAAAEVGSSRRNQTKTTSTSVVAQGGSQDIASILSDVYSPTFKTQFKDWLKSIPQYPKAFRFQMGSITDLLNFRANDLFPEETVNWGCEGNAANLHTEERNGKTVKYYETTDVNSTTTRYYCEFDSRQALEDAIQRRRTSLKRAIEIYMEEGTISISDIKLDNCTYATGDQTFTSEAQNPFLDSMVTPSWEKIVNHNKLFKVSFDLVSDLPNAYRKAFNIERNMSRLVQFYKNKWYTSNRDGSFHLYNAFNNGKSSDITKRKVSILGLVLTFDEAGGNLVLSESDFKVSKRLFPRLSEEMKGGELARVEIPHMKSEKRRSRVKRSTPESVQPCQVKWSNALRFDPTDTEGKCLHFTASSAGTIFVMFAALPKDRNSHYFVQISPEVVAIYKNTTLLKNSTDINARALGDASLYQSYFVCLTESGSSSLIEYGKSLGTADSGDIYLTVSDSDKHLNIRFYAFGNDENPAKVMDSHIVPRRLTRAECKGETVKDLETSLCHEICHHDCDPFAGCNSSTSPRLDDGCNACRVALDVATNTCIPECPQNQTLTAEKECRPSFDLETRITFNYSTPTFQELTLCTWIKVNSTYGTLSNKHFLFLLNIYDSQRSTFFITMKERTEHMKFATLIRPETPNVALRNSQKFNLDQLKDYEWHHISVTWSGFNGVVRVFLDGNNVYSGADRQQRGVVYGSPLTKIGDRYLSLTELNVWDHILSDQNIESNALKCDSGKGNVFQWHQFYEATMRNTTFYKKPSLCDDFS